MNEIARKKRELSRQAKILAVTGVLTAGLIAVLCSVTSYAASVTVDLGAGNAGAQFGVLEALLVVTLLALAPTLLIMMTSFTRIVIVLSFLRNALGTQQSPPSQVLIGLSLFLTMFIMWPVFTQINEEAYQPYRAGTITQQQAQELAEEPLSTDPEELKDLGMEVVVPAFVTSELKRAFTMGFLLYIPFLIIDMVVSSTLMSMGMVMLPPSMISLPFKIMVFVLVDGWGLLIGTLVRSFH